jgi:hypothetical protein
MYEALLATPFSIAGGQIADGLLFISLVKEKE